jgi:hypothetical protein
MTQRTITLAASQDALVANDSGTSYGAGRDDHLPVGKWTSWTMRSLIGFEDLPAKLAAEGATQVKAARLKAKTSGAAHLDVGGSPRAYLRRITAAWTAGTAGATESWSGSNAVEWSNQPAATTSGEADRTFPTGSNVVTSQECMALLRAALPVTVLDDLGAAGGGNTFHGIQLISFDEGSLTRPFELYSLEGSYAPYLELDIDDNSPPAVPGAITPAGGAVALSTTGTTLTVTFSYSDPDGDAMAAYQYRVWESGITDAMIAGGTAGTPLYDSGSVAATSPPAGATATGLARRSSVRPQIRVKDAKGSWGPYSTIDDRLVTLDAKPIPTNITLTPGTKTPTFAVSSSDPDSALGGTNGQISAIEVDVWTNTGLGRVYLWQSGKQSVALTARATIAYGSGGDTGDDPQFGQTYGWRLRIWDDADQPSDYTADAVWMPTEATGPEIMLPADTSTKLNDLTPDFTIGSTSGPFDQISFRVFADAARALKYYDAGVLAVGSTTVRATSNSGQPILAVNSIAGVAIGDTLRVNNGGGTQEDKVVLSTNAVGPTVTFTTNLGSTHNAAEPVGTMQAVRTYPSVGATALSWGSAPFWDAARRPVGSTALDPFSDLRQFRLNSLPSKPPVSVLTAGAVTRSDGVIVVPSRNPLLRIPYTDADVALYGELPTRKVLEIRQAATPKGSGALVETRTNTGLLKDDESVGEQIEGAAATTGWSAGGSTTLSVVATNPTGYGGSSLQLAIAGLAANGNSHTTKAITLPLSSYGNAATLKIWIRASSLTNVSFVKLTISGAGWTAEYTVTPSTTGVYEEKSVALSAYSGSTGTPFSTAATSIGIRTYATAGGAVTSNVLVRDIRIGSTQTAKTAPDAHLAFESSYDVRGQWGDAVAPGTMGTASDWTTIRPSQPPIVTLTAPTNAAVVTDPTPALTWTKSSPGGKATTSLYARVYRRVAGQDEEIWRSDLLDSLLTVTLPAYLLEHGGTYAWEVDVVDADGLVTMSSRFTFTTTFTKPTALASVTLTPDPARPRVDVSWPASADPNLYEYVVRRRRGNGDFIRIDAMGDPWEEGVSAPITATTIADYAPGLNISLDYTVQVSNGALDTATGLSDSVEGSTIEALDGWWYQVPGQENYTLELHYVAEWQEQKEISELIRQPLPGDDGQETMPIVQTGALEGSRIDVTMDVGPEDADQLRILRLASTTTAFHHGWLMSPLGDVWGAKPRAISQRKGGGAGRRQLTVPFLQVK